MTMKLCMDNYLQVMTSNSRLLGSTMNIKTKNPLLYTTLNCSNMKISSIQQFLSFVSSVENTFASSFLADIKLLCKYPF